MPQSGSSRNAAPEQQGYAARRAALWLIDKVVLDHEMLRDAMATGLNHLPPEDRARAQRLATETLRMMPRADKLCARFLKKAPPEPIRNILRLCTVEMAGAPDSAHGIVNAGVTMASRAGRHGKLKGLVNAVLRKVAEALPDTWDKLGAPRLPRWLREPLVDAYGPDNMARIEQAHEKGAALDLTAKANAAELAAAVGGVLLPTGTVRLENAGQVTALPGYEDGAFWVQDAAAALPVKLLEVQAGETVLDLCAAPGGKTMQLASLGATVTAIDISGPRMERVQQNLARTGLAATCITGDVFEHQGQYDAILLDAPCSATGTIRRHPDLPHARDGSDFMGLFELQARMIDHALTLLKPGGRLVYCTCSLLPDEGEVQVSEVLARHSGLVLEAMLPEGVPEEWAVEPGGIRTRPDYWRAEGGLDGFYMARLRLQA